MHAGPNGEIALKMGQWPPVISDPATPGYFRGVRNYISEAASVYGIFTSPFPFSVCVQVGDGTNFVLVFAGALLEHAEDLLRMGLSPPEVIEGYKMAVEKALNILSST